MKAQVIADHKGDLFQQGAAAAGYRLVDMFDDYYPKKEDILIAWNRKPSNIERINRYEAVGARVIIAENGYIGKADDGSKLIAMALSHHLGAGRWHVGAERRHLKQNFEILPWRKPGDEIVILAQRGIGESKDLAWSIQLQQQIRAVTKRPVRVRAHPGKSHEPVEPDIVNAHAVVTWASAAAIKAIAFGVPAFYMMPSWIGAAAAVQGINKIEEPFRGDREYMFHRLGWSQWTPDEVRSGEPFKYLGALE